MVITLAKKSQPVGPPQPCNLSNKKVKFCTKRN